MSLIKCPNCKATVSDKATVCPKCGKTTQYSTRTAKIWIWIFIIFFGGGGGFALYLNLTKFSTVSSATQNVKFKTFLCTTYNEDHKITLLGNMFTYYIKPDYAYEWIKVANGTYEVKEYRSEKKDKIGLFVRVEQNPNFPFLAVDLTEMKLYWAEQYIGKVEIE